MTAALPRVALSIRQPWAWLVANGHKDVENRDWPTNRRGPFLIHAGLKWDADGRDVLSDLWCGTNPATGVDLTFDMPAAWKPDLGGIIGVAEIVDCVAQHPSDWFVGDFGFVIRNARPLPLMPCKGQLGFFAVDYAPPGGPS